MTIRLFKKWINKLFPGFSGYYRKYIRTPIGSVFVEKTFTKIYLKNLWKDSESLSGPGSNLEATSNLRDNLPRLLNRIVYSRIFSQHYTHW